MRVGLLYRDSDDRRDAAYADAPDIIRDLGLNALFRAAARKLIYENGKVEKVDKDDPYLSETMRRVMMIPLCSGEEIAYRQGILRDCLRQEELIRGLYGIACVNLIKRDTAGSSPKERTQQTNPVTRLVSGIRDIRRICDSLGEIRDLFEKADPATGRPRHEGLVSEGFRGFYERFCAVFPREREDSLRRLLEDISFYTEGTEGETGEHDRTLRPRIVLECGLEDGLKFSSLTLKEISSESIRFYRPGSAMKKLQELRYSVIPDSFSVEKDPRLKEQAALLEYGVVGFLAERVNASVMGEFRSFFEQLKLQTAFYLGAIHINEQMDRFGMEHCFPEVTGRRSLAFRDLKEVVMGTEQRVNVIGNTCGMEGKELLIVTGANQGGKSTFLRSIGIAQVMMQCGLEVAAKEYRSGLFSGIFVHFTRREDSAMNSGRLEEELGRMDRIVDRADSGSLLLLNESFATTTEKEGSAIAYDIVRALNEAGVKILMVTHLLSFARRVYEEEKDGPGSRVLFLSAERRPDGRRTFRMIPHAPEATSFGLDLYEEIVEGKGGSDAGSVSGTRL